MRAPSLARAENARLAGEHAFESPETLMTTLPDQIDDHDGRPVPGSLVPRTRAVPTLEVSVPALLGPEYALVLDLASGFDQVVGRDASADVVVPDPTISRRHARITHDLGEVWLQDLGSTNGTCVNGVRLLDRRRLHDGDEVEVGNAVAVFHDVIRSPDPTRQLHVVRHTSETPDSSDRPETTMGASGFTCPRCSAGVRDDMWFCHRCGDQQRPIAVQQAGSARAEAQAVRRTLIDTHGNVRSWQFRQVMRVRNGGLRPSYNETLVIPALVLRVVVVVVLLVAVVAALAALSLGVHHVLELRQQPRGHSVTGHPHSFVPFRSHAQVR
jgi:pSer/pThr/pTyr-binding forkhead associated (FHA) protein